MRSPALFLVFAGGMELSWSFAWATFLTGSLLHRPFPFPEAALSFGVAAVLMLLAEGRGWRVVAIVGLQLAGFIPAAGRMVRVFSGWALSFPRVGGGEPISDALATADWMNLVLVLGWALLFWGGGVSLARRKRDYDLTCRRFDLGLGAFFLLFLADFALVFEGVKEPNHSAVGSFVAFIVLGLSAVATARNRAGERAAYLPGYRTLGVGLSFIAVVLAFGAGLILLALPYLSGAADWTWGAIRSTSELTFSALWRAALWLRTLLLGDQVDIVEELARKELAPDPTKTRSPSSPLLEGLGQVLAWAGLVAVGLVFLLIVGVTLYTLVRWLLSKTARNDGERLSLDWAGFWKRVRRLGSSIQRGAAQRLRGYRNAIELYGALEGWGRASGLPSKASETPSEYGSRLCDSFPTVKTEVDAVVQVFQREVYGGMGLTDEQLRQGRSALRRLRSPALWPSRWRIWFVQPGR